MAAGGQDAPSPRVGAVRGPDPPTTEAGTDYVQVVDDEGRLWLIPAVTRNHLLATGMASLTVKIGLHPAQPPRARPVNNCCVRRIATPCGMVRRKGVIPDQGLEPRTRWLRASRRAPRQLP